MLNSTTTTILIVALAILRVRADFFIANTTICYGAFPLNTCLDGAQVISEGVDYDTSFTCDQLWNAQSHRHIEKHSAGPLSTDFTSTSNVCDGERLYFERNYTSSNVNGTFEIYKGTDASSGENIGSCEYVEAQMGESKRQCGTFWGAVYFIGAYRCNSTVCGDGSSTTMSSSVTIETSTSTSSSGSSSSSITTTTLSSATTTGSVTDSSSITTSSTTMTSSASSTEDSSSTESTTSATSTTTSETSTSTTSSAAESTTVITTTTAAAAKQRRWIG